MKYSTSFSTDIQPKDWRPIPGLPGYRVNLRGQIARLKDGELEPVETFTSRRGARWADIAGKTYRVTDLIRAAFSD